MPFIKHECPDCHKKYQSVEMLSYHRSKVHGVEVVVSQKPIGITLRFSKHVEVSINGRLFATVPNEEEKNYQMTIISPFQGTSDMALAVEIMRLAREHYGDVMIRG